MTEAPTIPSYPGAVPELPVSDVAVAAEYYRDRLGFTVDWMATDIALAGISRDDCRLFLAGPPFRAKHDATGPVTIWLNLGGIADVDALHRAWQASGARLLGAPEAKPWGLHEFTAVDLDDNRVRVFHDFATPARERAAARATLFDAVGGDAGVRRLAHAWHERVLQDEIVAHAFSHGFHPEHTERLAAYWAEAWGGPAAFTGHVGSESDVVRMHSGHGPHEEMDARAVACFDRAMEDVGIDDARLRRVLHDYFAWMTTSRMAAYPKSVGDVPGDLALARWSWDGLQR